MKKILLLGAGKIGVIISELLASSGDYIVTVGDIDPANLKHLSNRTTIIPLKLDVKNVLA